MSRRARRPWTSALGLSALLLASPAAALTPAEEARVELTTYATLYGAGVGLWAALDFDLKPRPAAWLSAGLAGGALWGTWEAAQAREIQQNQASLISSAAAWAMVDTLLLHATFDVLDDDDAIWLTLGTGAAAAGLAFAFAPGLESSAGDLSLINSGGIWTPIAMTLLAAPAWDVLIENPFAWLLGSSTIGLGIGALVATQVQPTRAQALYLDAGLGIGLVGGGLLGVIGGVLGDSYELAALIALGGMVAGGWVAADIVGLDGGGPAVQAEQQPARARRTPPRARRTPPPAMPLWVGVW